MLGFALGDCALPVDGESLAAGPSNEEAVEKSSDVSFRAAEGLSNEANVTGGARSGSKPTSVALRLTASTVPGAAVRGDVGVERRWRLRVEDGIGKGGSRLRFRVVVEPGGLVGTIARAAWPRIVARWSRKAWNCDSRSRSDSITALTKPGRSWGKARPMLDPSHGSAAARLATVATALFWALVAFPRST